MPTSRKPEGTTERARPAPGHAESLGQLSQAATSLAAETRAGNRYLGSVEEKLDTLLSRLESQAERADDAVPRVPEELAQLTQALGEIREGMERLGERLDAIEGAQSGQDAVSERLGQIERAVSDQARAEVEAAETVRRAAEHFADRLSDRLETIEHEIGTLTAPSPVSAEPLLEAVAAVAPRLEEHADRLHRSTLQSLEDKLDRLVAGATGAGAEAGKAILERLGRVEENLAALLNQERRVRTVTDRSEQVAIRLLVDDFRARMNEIGEIADNARAIVSGNDGKAREEAQEIATRLDGIVRNQNEILRQLGKSENASPAGDAQPAADPAKRLQTLYLALAGEIAEIRPTLARAVAEVLERGGGEDKPQPAGSTPPREDVGRL